MSSTNLTSYLPSATTALPILTSAMGVLALGGGVFSFNSPIDSARTFGIVLPSKEISASDAKLPALSQFQTPTSPSLLAYIRVHGTRNLGSGISLLTLTLFSKFSPICRESPVAAKAIRQALGLSLLMGPVVGLLDAWIVGQYAKALEEGAGAAAEEEKEAVEVAKKTRQGHLFMTAPMVALGIEWLMS